MRSDTWENGDWVHCAFTVQGRAYGVSHFDAPTNPRPNRYSTRPYGRFGSFFESEVAKDKVSIASIRLGPVTAARLLIMHDEAARKDVQVDGDAAREPPRVDGRLELVGLCVDDLEH